MCRIARGYLSTTTALASIPGEGWLFRNGNTLALLVDQDWATRENPTWQTNNAADRETLPTIRSVPARQGHDDPYWAGLAPRDKIRWLPPPPGARW